MKHRIGTLICLTILSLWSSISVAAERVMIFAAASTTDAINEATKAFEAESGIKVIASFAGSSVLAKQVVAGAPADLYLSANVRWMDYAEQNGGIVANTRKRLLGNRLVLITQKDAPTLNLGSLTGYLADQRLAMGDTDHVPAGMYGRMALEELGLWKGLRSRVIQMPNVRSALTLVNRGEAAAGIVYATDAPIAANTTIALTFPAFSYPPIIYPIALTIEGAKNQAAHRFLEFLTGEKAHALFSRYGFTRPTGLK